ncbi:membrane protein [Gordonia phage Syleon]|uniref:Membrane protein n=1 Tax=Gordonia phage Syleon TaxID=2653718 RepID=A0A5Q2WEG1_9CAUD|nr:membrane protein [Gordonia phage Syleon]QGH75770.1 membrane protein [Gordonia phage Syleon]
MTLTSLAVAGLTALPVAAGAAALLQRRRWLKSNHCCWLTLSLIATTLAWLLFTPPITALDRLLVEHQLNYQIGATLVVVGTATLSIHMLAAIGALSRNERIRTERSAQIAVAISWIAYANNLDVLNQLALTVVVTYYAAIICQAAGQIVCITPPGSVNRKAARYYRITGFSWAVGSLLHLVAAIFPCISDSLKLHALNVAAAVVISVCTYMAAHISYRKFAKPLIIPETVPPEWLTETEDNS